MYKKYLILILFANLAFAGPQNDHEEIVHLLSHIGMTYVINTTLYGIYSKGFGMPQNTALMFSSWFTLSIGMSYLMMSHASNKHIARSMAQNGAGLFLNVLTIKGFDF